jgi:hypothetical protein
LSDSPVIDAGSGTVDPLDQRGAARPFDGDGDGIPSADIGSVERGAPFLILPGKAFPSAVN